MDRYKNMAEQVLVDILLYLPVISLFRFKTVCKYWFSLIENSDFISEHLNHNRDRMEDSLIILGDVNDEVKFALVCGSQYEECVHDIGIGQFLHPATAGDLSMPCYCDGIVCLMRKNEIALWNPALKQLRPIPPSFFSDLSRGTSSLLKGKRKRWTRREVNVSFGIDFKSSDYKIVGIMMEYSEHSDLIGNQVEVYNLRGGNSWRIIHKNDVLPFCNFFTFSPISSGKSGKCFWIAHRYDKAAILLSFDFSDDVFSTMLLPAKASDLCKLNLDFLDDKVVYIVEHPRNRRFDIWMLHEFGVEQSWNKIYTVRPLGYIERFSYFEKISSRRISKNGEFLVCSKRKLVRKLVSIDMLYLYNLRSQQGKFVESCNLNIGCSGEIIHYNASLVSLKSGSIVKSTD